MRLKLLYETILDTIKVDGGSAFLVNYEYADIYCDILDNLEVDVEDWDDYVFIEDLRGGGGSGLIALEAAIEAGKRYGKVLIFVQSHTDQEKLMSWYLNTGLLDRTKLQNVLVAK